MVPFAINGVADSRVPLPDKPAIIARTTAAERELHVEILDMLDMESKPCACHEQGGATHLGAARLTEVEPRTRGGGGLMLRAM